MTNEQQRPARLRLARQQSRPNRVRPRVRDAPPEPEPDPEPTAGPEVSRARRALRHARSAKWGHIVTVGGTALAAFAAIGGLWAQTVATYWSQQTAKDQLEQSQEDSKRELRAQASRVSSITYLAVVPDPDNHFYRARQGQVGLTECAALARTLREITAEDEERAERRAIVAVVDLPSQAYGRIEEMAGLHQAIASAVDAAEAARIAGHPLITLVVGQALSGGFLAHGLQASQILALNDPGVEIHAMHRKAAAQITLRTVDQLDELAMTIPPLSYDVRDWATLGFCDGLLSVENADTPTRSDVRTVAQAIGDAITRARSGPTDLSNRLESTQAKKVRKASRTVRDTLARQWNEQ
ncbi:biotin-independent malonate decarboxylase subunit gamma [Streptomyces sp. NPDC004362]|uniref:biotin-independent malonate decarboxylase subunit gamma n=1 Tax=Streptomyces sp. NPDC004362 TaxID=3154456 RepID=UPI0033A98504